jgi:hypothetical protein
MDRELARVNEKPGAEDWTLHLDALVSAYSGHLQQARKASERAIDLALHVGQHERAATYDVGAAVWESLVGNATASKCNAAAALELSRPAIWSTELVSHLR